MQLKRVCWQKPTKSAALEVGWTKDAQNWVAGASLEKPAKS